MRLTLMKTSFLPSRYWMLLLAAFSAVALQAAAPPSSKTNSPEPEIPKSVFILPSNPKEGKDPFFPKSVHPYASAVAKTTRAVQPVTLVLNGITPHRVASSIHNHGRGLTSRSLRCPSR